MEKMKVQDYIKANHKKIVSNWRKNEFIREKHGYSLLNYISAIRYHIANVCQVRYLDSEISEYGTKLYKTL